MAERIAQSIERRTRLRCKSARGNIEERETKRRFGADENRGKKIIGGSVKNDVLGDGARRDNARDFAADNALGERGVLGLVADGDFFACADGLGKVGVERVVRDATKRRACAGCERNAKDGRGALRVIKEEFVEIADAEEEQGVGREL